MSKVALTGNASGTGTITLASPNTNTSTTYTLPSADGTSGQVLQTDASGGLSFGNVGVANITGTLPVANGGTGSTTLTANNVLLGNGTSALQVVAPGTSGNVLTSNGTTWTSAAAGGGAWNFITSATASSSTTVSIENAMTQYGMYVIVATGLNMSASGYLQIQLKIGGSYRTDTTYYWVTDRIMTPASNSTGSGADYIRLGEGNSLPNNTSYGMMLTLYLPNPSSAQYKTTYSVMSGFDSNLTNVDLYNTVGGYKGSTGALTGVKFYNNNARTMNGTFRLYGISNS